MMVEVMDMPIIDGINISVGGTAAFEPNDQILRIMHNLGIDSQRAKESLKVSTHHMIDGNSFLRFIYLSPQTNSYDHYTAFYLLLLERIKNKENAVAQNGTAKHPSLESQRRRPSSIAEQAMRKLGLGSISQQR